MDRDDRKKDYENSSNLTGLRVSFDKRKVTVIGETMTRVQTVSQFVNYEVNDTRDEAYKIVFGKKLPHYNGEEKIYSTKLAENAIYTFLAYNEYIDEIYVDGVKQFGTELALENKKMYQVKYIENIDNSAESIFDIKDYFE